MLMACHHRNLLNGRNIEQKRKFTVGLARMKNVCAIQIIKLNRYLCVKIPHLRKEIWLTFWLISWWNRFLSTKHELVIVTLTHQTIHKWYRSSSSNILWNVKLPIHKVFENKATIFFDNVYQSFLKSQNIWFITYPQFLKWVDCLNWIFSQ